MSWKCSRNLQIPIQIPWDIVAEFIHEYLNGTVLRAATVASEFRINLALYVCWNARRNVDSLAIRRSFIQSISTLKSLIIGLSTTDSGGEKNSIDLFVRARTAERLHAPKTPLSAFRLSRGKLTVRKNSLLPRRLSTSRARNLPRDTKMLLREADIFVSKSNYVGGQSHRILPLNLVPRLSKNDRTADRYRRQNNTTHTLKDENSIIPTVSVQTGANPGTVRISIGSSIFARILSSHWPLFPVRVETARHAFAGSRGTSLIPWKSIKSFIDTATSGIISSPYISAVIRQYGGAGEKGCVCDAR